MKLYAQGRQKSESQSFLVAGEACKAIFDLLTPGLKERTFDRSVFSAKSTLIFATAVFHSGVFQSGTNNDNYKPEIQWFQSFPAECPYSLLVKKNFLNLKLSVSR